jgi:hypothetical protein
MIRFFTAVLFVAGCAQAQPPGNDPIFGMNFDAARVHFEKAPATLKARCPKLWDRISKNEVFYVFAAATLDGKEYLLLSSRTTEVSGAGLMLEGSKCTEIAADGMIDDVPEPVGKALAADAFRRYARAYGNKKAFLEAERKGGLKPDEMGKRLRAEFEAFSRQP